MSAALSLWARDLLAYSVQLGAVVATGLVLSGLLRMRAPRVKLAFAQGLFALALALPWVQPWTTPTDEGASVTVAFRARETAAHAALDPWPIVGALLVLGALVRLAVLARRLWRLRRCRRLSRGVELSPVIADAWARVGVQARVCWSDEIDVPAAFGVRRPVVLVPPRFATLGDAAQQAVLCHELVHVRRRDWLQMLVEELAAVVLWFHPAVWWLLSRIRLAREQVVDQEAVRLTQERRVYLETLVGLARIATPPPAPAPLFLTESHLERRVDVLLKEVAMSKARIIAGLAASVAGVTLAGGAAAWAFPLEAPATALQQPPEAGVQGGVPGGVEGGVPGGVAGGVAGGVPGGVAGGLADSTSEGGAEAKKAPERKVVRHVNPVYPAEAKKKAIEGLVLIDVVITAAGDVKDVKVTKGPSELHESAVSAVSQWKYEAGPHDTRATLTINYRLSKKDEKPRP